MSDETVEQRSEFGDGYAYCLGLFIAHEERIRYYREMNEKSGRELLDASIWFNGAADHLYGLTAPPSFSEEEKRGVEQFRQQCLSFRLCMNGEECTWDDAHAACKRAKAMLLEWDRMNGILAIKGDWE